MKAYQHILCAIDFSHQNEEAVERAAELARMHNAQLTLFHVVEYFPEDRSTLLIAPEDVDPAVYEKNRASKMLTDLATKLDHSDTQIDVRLSPHSAKHEIIGFAQNNSVDLIVLATHGHHGIFALLGSTASGIAHSSPCDVLTVRSR